MKRLMILSLVLGILSACTIGSVKKEKAMKLKKVPSEVVAAFFKRHPEASSNFHKQEIDDVETYEAHYMVADKENSERFTKSGELIETEEEIEFSSIDSIAGQKIKAYLDTEDKDHKNLKSQKVHSKEFEGYEFRTKTNKSTTGLMEYFFNLDGSFNHQEELELKSIPTLY